MGNLGGGGGMAEYIGMEGHKQCQSYVIYTISCRHHFHELGVHKSSKYGWAV